MPVDYVSFGGWANNIRIANEHAELIITLDVGPRVISYRTADGENVFKTFDAHLGGTGESEWKSRGGHRFWLAPEHPVLSYLPDNTPVQHRVISAQEVEVENAPVDQLPMAKSMRVALEPTSTRVTVTHRAENVGDTPFSAATWGLSVMRPGGVEIIPLPALGEHPRDLLPNRTMILWPFTDMSDPRWRWGRRFITLRQGDAGPTKAGLAHRERWIAYHRGDSLFVKTIEFDERARYADLGCNFETFTNEEMLEVEALGPLVHLAPAESTSHIEQWQLFDGVTPPPDGEDDALTGWIAPHLKRARIAV
ncbi:MAG TPA: hypothetical protein VK993_13440 [Chthoniobacterales bacterium]|nr:hypothetical protein [Chthoniobacterales bacterium]